MSRERMGLQTDENWLDMHADRWRIGEPNQSTGVVLSYELLSDTRGRLGRPRTSASGGQALLGGSDRQAGLWEMAAGGG